MTLHFDPTLIDAAPVRARRDRGQMAHLAGMAAEDAVLRHYLRQGARLLARRWRGKAGEIDLVFSSAGGLIFVEVKTAPTVDRAMAALRPQQMRRVCQAAQEFAGAPAAFDVAASE